MVQLDTPTLYAILVPAFFVGPICQYCSLLQSAPATSCKAVAVRCIVYTILFVLLLYIQDDIIEYITYPLCCFVMCVLGSCIGYWESRNVRDV